MPLALIFVGLLLMIAGVRNKQSDLYDLILGDFTGPNNFAYWVLAVGAVGSLGYIDKLKGFSTAFLSLLIIVLLVKKDRGFFDEFTSAFSATVATKAQTEKAPAPRVLDPQRAIELIPSASDAAHAAWNNKDLLLMLGGIP